MITDTPKFSDIMTKGYIYLFLFIIVLLLVQSVVIIYLPTLSKDYILELTSNNVSTSVLLNVVIYLVIAQTGLILLGCLISIVSTFISSSMQFRLRKLFFESMAAKPLSFFRQEEIGQMQSNFGEDLEVINQFITQDLPNLLTSFLGMVFIIAVLFYYNIGFGIVLILLICIITVVTLLMYRVQKRYSNKLRDQYQSISQYFLESIQCIDVIKSFASEEKQTQSFARYAKTFQNTLVRSSIVQSVLSIPISIFQNSIGLSIMLFGALALSINHMGPELIILCLFYAGILQVNLSNLIGVGSNFHYVKVAYERLDEFFMQYGDEGFTEEIVNDNRRELLRLPQINNIEFKDVSFGYTKDQNIVKDLSFKLSLGESLAIKGSSGSGKTTIANILLQFYRPSKGSYLVNGNNSIEYSHRDFMANIAYFNQQTFLFQASIRENIAFFKDNVRDIEVMDALDKAGIRDFVSSLPRGIETELGCQGFTLSSGQRQRLALARVFLKDSPVIVFDEPTNFLDSESEKIIYNAIESMREKKIIIIISHKDRMLELADRILSL